MVEVKIDVPEGKKSIYTIQTLFSGNFIVSMVQGDDKEQVKRDFEDLLAWVAKLNLARPAAPQQK